MHIERRIALAVIVAGLVAGCGGQIGGASAGGPPGSSPLTERAPGGEESADVVRSYEQAGMLANVGAFPFVGTVAYYAGPSADSTLSVLTVSFADRVLTFSREEDRYRATYEARVEVLRGNTAVRIYRGTQTVRVATFQETARRTESVIFEQTMNLSPGDYTLVIDLHDNASARAANKQILISVPATGPGTLATPLSVYQAYPRDQTDSAPRVIASPRSTVTFGRDTVFHLYEEGYGDGSTLPVSVTAHYTDGTKVDTTPVWSDTIALPRHSALFSGVAVVPISRIGIGSAALIFRRIDGHTTDSVRALVFVGFGEDLPVGSYDRMLDFLKYFPAHDRVEALRNLPPQQRAAAWQEFVRVTDPIPSTPQNEALENYFQRLRQANDRFIAEGVPGWQTDRGMVYLTLGEPDQSYSQGTLRYSTRGGQQVWIYRQYNTQLIFEDVNGRGGRYKLTSRSLTEFQALLKRIEGSPAQSTPPAPTTAPKQGN